MRKSKASHTHKEKYAWWCTCACMHYQKHTHRLFKASWQQKSFMFLAATQLSSISAKTNPSIPVDTIFILAIAAYTNLFTLLIYWCVFFQLKQVDRWLDGWKEVIWWFKVQFWPLKLVPARVIHQRELKGDCGVCMFVSVAMKRERKWVGLMVPW